MPYWLTMTMLIDYNVMNERNDKEDKKQSDIKSYSGMGFAKFM